MRETTQSAPSSPRLWKGFLFACGTLLLAVACATGSTPTASPTSTATFALTPAATDPPTFPLTLKDDDGTNVTITERPERIVSLTPAATETLYAIDAGDRLVGKVDDLANFPPEAAEVPIVGTFAGVDVEKIVDLDTDLVIAGGSGGTPPETVAQLRRLHIPVLVVYAPDIDTVFADIELIGDATGDGDAARELTASMRAQFDQIEAATAGVDPPEVFYETGDQPQIYGVADNSFVSAMLELAGSDPLTTGSSTAWEMSVESLIEADPEMIILGDAAYGVTAESVAARPGWEDLTAVREQRIYPIDDIVVTRPGPRLAEGLRALVSVIHPEIAAPTQSAAATALP